MIDAAVIAALRDVLTRGEAAMWVTITSAQGSTPREVGAAMLVTAKHTHGTVGGGQLEWRAIELARERLAIGERRATRRHVPLGPALGQCCGGAIELALVPIAAAGGIDWPRLIAVAEQGGQFAATVALDDGGSIELGLNGRPWQIVVFGGGHVGRTLIDVLATLPCRVRWIESRDDALPQHLALTVTAVAGADAVAQARRLPAGADALVLTHSHALDFDIVYALLRDADPGFLGMIGSRTKAATFRRRLAARGLAAPTIARLHCPIGRGERAEAAAGVDWAAAKHPGVIAVSVASELIQRQQLLAERRIHNGLAT